MEQENRIAIIIIFGSALFIFLSLVVAVLALISRRKITEKQNRIVLLEKEKQIELLTAIAKAEDVQKIKIAGQLHDEILPIINNVNAKINETVADLEKQGVEIKNIRQHLQVFPLLNEGIREIIHDIVPKLFTSFGLLKSIEIYIRDMNKGHDGTAEFHNNTTFSGEPPFSVNDQLLIYKIFREIFNNLQKHSKYEYLTVTLEEYEKNFTLLFSHDGLKITNERIQELKDVSLGMGLKLLESRILILNASINYSFDSEASYVRLKIPIA